jgi:hypothetical protein
MAEIVLYIWPFIDCVFPTTAASAGGTPAPAPAALAVEVGASTTTAAAAVSSSSQVNLNVDGGGSGSPCLFASLAVSAVAVVVAVMVEVVMVVVAVVVAVVPAAAAAARAAMAVVAGELLVFFFLRHLFCRGDEAGHFSCAASSSSSSGGLKSGRGWSSSLVALSVSPPTFERKALKEEKENMSLLLLARQLLLWKPENRAFSVFSLHRSYVVQVFIPGGRKKLPRSNGWSRLIHS